MDPLAHTLFGATLAEAGLKRKTALATGTLIIGANIPDVDAIAMFWGSDHALYVRRGWTHGILALVLWPFVLTGVMLLYDKVRSRLFPAYETWQQTTKQQETTKQHSPPPRSVQPGALLGISFLAVWSHPFLDWLNTYGIRLLMPFDDTWFYGDTLFIIDPWVWLLTGAAVVLARSESGFGIAGWIVLGAATTAIVTGTAVVPPLVRILWCAGITTLILLRWTKQFHTETRTVAVVCLGALGFYLAFMHAGSLMTVRIAEAELNARDIEVHRTMAAPVPARLLVREGVAASDHHYYRFRVNWLRNEFELLGEPVPVPPEEPGEIVQKALESPDIQGLRTWMRFPYYEVYAIDDGWQVIIRDLRFAGPDQMNDTGIGIAVVEVRE